MVSTNTLIKIAGWGGVIVSTTGFYLSYKLVDKIRDYDYYKNALKSLRTHSGAVYYMGEPIKDGRFKITDSENNYSDDTSARFCVPVYGTKDKGKYYFWAENKEGTWNVSKAELELNSQPDGRLVIVKEKVK